MHDNPLSYSVDFRSSFFFIFLSAYLVPNAILYHAAYSWGRLKASRVNMALGVCVGTVTIIGFRWVVFVE